MRTALMAMAMVWTLAGSVAAQCCGDCDGDGAVSISELVTAVNKALNGCVESTPTEPKTPTPTPANRCPSTFQETNGLCIFRGHFNQGCGAELTSVFTSNGVTLVIEIDTMVQPQTTVRFGAVVDSPTRAHLTAWSTDNFQTTHLTDGQVELNGDGQQLVIFPNDPPFMIQGCNFVRYSAEFIGTAGR